MEKIYVFLVLVLFTTGCKKGSMPSEITKEPPTDRNFSNVVILGNSITKAGPDPSIGWNNDWGMAATKPEFDYVHLLTSRLKTVNPNCQVNVRNIAHFEGAYTTYDYAKDYKDLRDLKPDLIIIRIGENVIQDNPNLSQFDEKYVALMAYFRDGNPNVKFLAVGSFWGNQFVDQVMQKYSKFVSLRPLLNDISNQAFGQFENHSVGLHPSDKGMLEICDVIWEALNGL